MSKTLAQLRTALAQAVGMYFTCTAAQGTTTTIEDNVNHGGGQPAHGLQRYQTADQLNRALAFILDTTDHLAPKGESRTIVDYAYTNVAPLWEQEALITVAPAFSVAPDHGDTYELYLANDWSLAEWTECINEAILAAAPEVWFPDRVEVAHVAATDTYNLPADCIGVNRVYLESAEPAFVARGQIPLAEGIDWTVGVPAGDNPLLLSVLRIPRIVAGNYIVFYRAKYPALAADGDSSYLDEGYILAAAQAEFYGRMQALSKGTTHEVSYQTLLGFWRGEAARIKANLAAALAATLSGQGAAPQAQPAQAKKG